MYSGPPPPPASRRRGGVFRGFRVSAVRAPSDSRWRRIIKISVFCGGIGLALYLLFRGTADFSVSLFVNQLRNVSLLRLSMFVLPFAVGLWVKWFRWHLCIQHVDHTVLGRTVFRAQLWGYCASNTLPFKAGEAVKLAVLKKKGHRVLPLLPTIALDRFWDGAVLLLLLLLALPFFSESAWMREMAVVAAVLFVGGLVCFCVFIFFLSEPFFVRLGDRMKGLLQGFLALRSVRLWSALACLSLINWLAEAWCFAVVFWAFGVSVPLAASMVAVAAVNFAGLAIAVPASVGVFEFCVVAVLIAVGVSQKTAFGMALVLHGLMVLPLFVISGGVLLMARFGKRRRICRG